VGADDIYRIYFHGPTYQVLDSAGRTDGTVTGTFRVGLPPNHQPADLPLLTWPRLVELCFQTAGVHQLGTTGAMALPAGLRRLQIAGDPQSSPDGFRAVVVPHDGGADAVVVDGEGQVVLRLDGYTTTVLPGGPDSDLLAPLHEAMT
jgi:hypothetical protein